ncbi:trigger factor [[Clostridium] saccharolyticum WM1]|uniref:peptidylprolyl isomerase n=2 Tax=Lacrimispora TaxID=2719231 RepID=D9R2H0_LACSW|nr:trigger factor [[Clostridium] saccharolyticum WM1]QRV22209.1 trigger factor [Lacrimispora saccharolytica]
MKKIFKICMCGMLAAALISGCGKKPAAKPAETGTEAAEATESAAQETLAVEDLTGMDNGTVTLGEYKGIEVSKDSVEVTDDEVNQAVQSDLSAHAKDAEVDRAVQNGDVVNIDYVGTKDGVAFDGGTAQGYDLTIGSGQFIEGFEEGLVGAKKGDKKTLNLTFPEGYQNADLAGKAVVFDVTVNAVKEEQVPELNDAFVQENTSFKTVAEYKEDKMQTLLKNKSDEAEQKMKSDIYTAILNASKVEPKQEAVDANFNNLIARYSNQAAAYGMDFKTFVGAFSGMGEEEFKEILKTQAEATVEQRLVVSAIAEKEGIQITDEDRKEVADQMGYESVDKMIETAGQFDVDDYIMNNKVMDFLTEKAVIK